MQEHFRGWPSAGGCRIGIRNEMLNAIHNRCRLWLPSRVDYVARTLSRRANAEQKKGPEELRKTSVDGHADQDSLTVKSCPRVIVGASPR